MIDILCIGSCRSSELPSSRYKLHNFTYTHSTKEVIQLLLFAYKDIEEQQKILNEKYILTDMSINKFKDIRNLCDNSSTILIEISSIKELSNNNGYYYNQWIVRDFKIEDATINLATVEIIKNDIKIIKELLPSKNLIFQSHINLDFNGMDSLKHIKIIPPIESRSIIDKALITTDGIKKIIPREVFGMYDWTKIVVSETDTCHMTLFAKNILAEVLDKI